MPVEKGSSIDPARTRATVVAMTGPILYERGIDGVGVAELCNRLGISKETLYRHFGTKDGLVLAVLEERSARVLRWLADSIAAAGGDPLDEIAATFDALAEWYAEPGFRGCALLNAAAQHRDPAVRDVVARHLDGYLDLFTGIAQRAGATDARTLAVQLLILVEGTTVVADHHAQAPARKVAFRAAETLLEAALSTTPRARRHA
jgi:AcrR family transcriptional regulator